MAKLIEITWKYEYSIKEEEKYELNELTIWLKSTGVQKSNIEAEFHVIALRTIKVQSWRQKDVS